MGRRKKNRMKEEKMSIGSSSNSDNFLEHVDDSYFYALFDYDEIYPICDEKFALELHLQEVLVSSSSFSAASTQNAVKEEKIEEKLIPAAKGIKRETGESCGSFCNICMDMKPASDMFDGFECPHSFCTDCIVRYVATKIKENVPNVKCPDVNCTGVLEPYRCQGIIPKDVFERWESALFESMFLSGEKFYCPFKDCSAVMVVDGNHGEGTKVRLVECPICHRLFCAQCKVLWHGEISCEEYQKLGKGERSSEDAMVMEMAKKQNWRRCPKCKFYVEKVEGCMHISCRCGHQFCYRCGLDWNHGHAC